MSTVATPPRRPYAPPPQRTRSTRAWIPKLLLALLLLALCGVIAAGIGQITGAIIAGAIVLLGLGAFLSLKAYRRD